MNVQVLYLEGCPHHAPTMQQVRAVLGELGLDAELSEVPVRPSDDLKQLRFLGSPTVLVDGVDIEPAARRGRDYNFGCRQYADGGGVPPRELIAAALKG